jgi:hypothetical protein
VLAYRANVRVTRHNSPAWHAAYAAFREVLPDIPEAQKHETTHVSAGHRSSPYTPPQNHFVWFAAA